MAGRSFPSRVRHIQTGEPVSAGVAVSDPVQSLQTIEQLYGQADERLYRAKRLGRNRVLAD